MSWNTDISAAPRGKTVQIPRMVTDKKTGDKVASTYEEFVPDVLWLASACGKVIRSYWVESRKNWAGFQDTPPVAWQPYVIPVHPNSPVAVEEEFA